MKKVKLVSWARIIIIVFLIILPCLAFGSLIQDGVTIFETYDRISNKYFYAAIGLFMVTIPALAKITNGERLRPTLSKSIAYFIRTLNLCIVLFLVIHFQPEMGAIFDWVQNFFKRMFL
jgi:hypothetical protein